jgi:P pilus assembly chaperone PapD
MTSLRESVASAALLALALLIAPGSPARAELVLSQLIIDLSSASKERDDIEVWNNSDERAYVVAEPSEVLFPGTAAESRRAEPDPEKRGLLVSPARMILEPGQRKIVRVAAIGPQQDRERVYRITIKPVVGGVSSAETGLKLLIGYDVLVLLKPATARQDLSANRSGNSLTFKNNGNASLELIDGKQCDSNGRNCVDLPGKRLYAGAEWTQQLKSNLPVEYSVVSNGQSARRKF